MPHESRSYQQQIPNDERKIYSQYGSSGRGIGRVDVGQKGAIAPSNFLRNQIISEYFVETHNQSLSVVEKR